MKEIKDLVYYLHIKKTQQCYESSITDNGYILSCHSCTYTTNVQIVIANKIIWKILMDDNNKLLIYDFVKGEEIQETEFPLALLQKVSYWLPALFSNLKEAE